MLDGVGVGIKCGLLNDLRDEVVLNLDSFLK